jgi:amidase
MARTVADAVAIFDAIAGYDPADPVTAESQGKMPAEGYTKFLVRDGLQGARIGVLRHLLTDTAHAEMVQLFEHALMDIDLLID